MSLALPIICLGVGLLFLYGGMRYRQKDFEPGSRREGSALRFSRFVFGGGNPGRRGILLLGMIITLIGIISLINYIRHP